jgi:hypothetical protein
VRFLADDVVYPTPSSVLPSRLRSVVGDVVATTTDGETTYLVVRIPGVAEALIVPIEKTVPVARTDEELARRGNKRGAGESGV